MGVRIDSEFQLLIPPLTNDEFLRLEKSILAEGVRDPLITWNGTIIDGHNRYHICEKHGIEFKTVEHKFTSRDAAKIWIIENQFGRRNLSSYDRAQLALQLEPLYAAEAKKRKLSTLRQNATDVPNSALRTDAGKTRDKVAQIAGVGHDTLRKVKIIEMEAAKGNETAIEARDAIKAGNKSIHKAFTEVRSNGDKADSRPLCTVCGKPINEGEAYDHDKLKHKACAYKLEKKRTKEKARFAEDGRRICTICGEPIDEGGHYTDKLNWHYSCGLHRETENQRKYRDADSALRANVPTYTTDSLKAELLASVKTMKAAISESIAINESMGVKLTSKQKKDLDAEVGHLIRIINKI